MLTINNLQVSYGGGRDGRTVVVRGVNLEVPSGGAVALVGESGSGKSSLVLSVMRLINPPIGQVEEGSITLDDVDLLKLDKAAMRRVLHEDIGYIPQDPSASLDPLCTIGRHVDETLSGSVPRQKRRPAITALLESLGVASAGTRLNSYPHEFSGGMKQRVTIATALARNPKLIIADEPTTALDVTTQLGILRLIDRLRRETGVSLLFVTHDLAVARLLCQHVAVMYAGEVVEQGPIEVVMRRPLHPYTRALVAAIPHLSDGVRTRLRSIPGQPPAPSDVPGGCPFAPRCSLAESRCIAEKPVLERYDEVAVACWNAEKGLN
jgi:oligopeptide/dipeptide ABC transporter ATP-binding protein